MLNSYITMKFAQVFHRAENANTLYLSEFLAHLSKD